MQVGMEFVWVFPECMDRHHNTGDPILQTNHFPQKGQEAPVCTLTEAGEQGTIIFEVNTQHDRNTEDILPVRNRIENVFVQVMPENNGAFGHTGSTDTPFFT